NGEENKEADKKNQENHKSFHEDLVNENIDIPLMIADEPIKNVDKKDEYHVPPTTDIAIAINKKKTRMKRV
ncbi:unnamed protein product, partial [Adineta steineri]